LRLERIPANILCTPRDLEVYRSIRKSGFISNWKNTAEDSSYCSEYWADLKIGQGACGFRCAECFLILTHRVKADPSRHELYENVDDFYHAVKQWMKKPGQRQTLGLGIDCSDSLLYEGVTGHARRLIPLFADEKANPYNRKLVLLTKSANVHYLEGLPARNVVVIFSLNPEPIADLFEGHYPDGLRITPPIQDRLKASEKAQGMGFEIRWRIDPVIPVQGWQSIYEDFFLNEAGRFRPSRITFGIYRQMAPGLKLKTFSQKWGLQPMPWKPEYKMLRDKGTHQQLPTEIRIGIYRFLREMVEMVWPEDGRPGLALCKETIQVRNESGISGTKCNCE